MLRTAIICVGLIAAVSARAETRAFIVESNADGYGVDRCLSDGQSCGTTIATAFCQSRDFTSARSFRKIEPHEVTAALSGSGPPACAGNCSELVEIECSR